MSFWWQDFLKVAEDWCQCQCDLLAIHSSKLLWSCTIKLVLIKPLYSLFGWSWCLSSQQVPGNVMLLHDVVRLHAPKFKSWCCDPATYFQIWSKEPARGTCPISWYVYSTRSRFPIHSGEKGGCTFLVLLKMYIVLVSTVTEPPQCLTCFANSKSLSLSRDIVPPRYLMVNTIYGDSWCRELVFDAHWWSILVLLRHCQAMKFEAMENRSSISCSSHSLWITTVQSSTNRCWWIFTLFWHKDEEVQIESHPDNIKYRSLPVDQICTIKIYEGPHCLQKIKCMSEFLDSITEKERKRHK